MFPFGGHKWVAWDFGGPDVEPEEVREAMRLRRRVMVCHLTRLATWSKKRTDGPVTPENKSISEMSEKEGTSKIDNEPIQYRQVSFAEEAPLAVMPTEGVCSLLDLSLPTEIGQLSPISSERATTMVGGDASIYKVPSHFIVLKQEQNKLPLHVSHQASNPSEPPAYPRLGFLPRKFIIEFLKAFFSPTSVAIFLSFPIALIPKLKALFVKVPGTYMPSGPDGDPPLAFFLDATSFVGAASVPLGLICLGSSLARLKIPKKKK